MEGQNLAEGFLNFRRNYNRVSGLEYSYERAYGLQSHRQGRDKFHGCLRRQSVP